MVKHWKAVIFGNDWVKAWGLSYGSSSSAHPTAHAPGGSGAWPGGLFSRGEVHLILSRAKCQTENDLQYDKPLFLRHVLRMTSGATQTRAENLNHWALLPRPRRCFRVSLCYRASLSLSPLSWFWIIGWSKTQKSSKRIKFLF